MPDTSQNISLGGRETQERMRAIDKPALYLGIMVVPSAGAGGLPFGEPRFCRRLTLAGAQLGMAVFVFSPEWIDWQRRSVRGYFYDLSIRGWRQRRFPFPDIVYDRSFYRSMGQQRKYRALLARLLAFPGVQLLSRALPDKLEVYRMLSGEPRLSRMLPRTERYTGPRSLYAWLKDQGEALVKPQGGTHGKGVLHLRRTEHGTYEACGRNAANLPIRLSFEHPGELLRWAHRSLLVNRPYLIQQYLHLRTSTDSPYDIRALMQKDGRGRWRLTGMVGRIGRAGGVTSNLHGGGRPCSAGALLASEFGKRSAQHLCESIQDAAALVPQVLEQEHGGLAELGIDFGVDRAGQLWLLEVNSKPGRESFARLNDKKAGIAAITSPIRYARYVLDRQLGGQIHEFDVKQSAFYSQFK